MGKYYCTPDLKFKCPDSAALVMLSEQQIYLFCQIQTSQTGGQPYSDTSPKDVSEYSLIEWKLQVYLNESK